MCWLRKGVLLFASLETLESFLALNIGFVLAWVDRSQLRSLHSFAIVLRSLAAVQLFASLIGEGGNLSLLVGNGLLGCSKRVLSGLQVCLCISLVGCELGNLLVFCLGESIQLVILFGKSIGMLRIKVAELFTVSLVSLGDCGLRDFLCFVG